MPLIPALGWRGTVAGVAGGIVLAALVLPGAAPAVGAAPVAGAATATPIKHVVVLYQENHSFDNYFGTYPNAANPPGEPALHAAAGTPSVNGLSEEILTHNPNLVNPFRLDRSQEITCDNNHNDAAMQKAYDHGLLDRFVQEVGPTGPGYSPSLTKCDPSLTMGYYDGNTVTALWNYAQRYAMNDNNFNDTFDPSTPQALNLISGQTHGAVPTGPTENVLDGTMVKNLKPANDDCDASNNGSVKATMTGRTIGDLLNARNVSWGWFTGGFRPTARVNGTAVCGTSSTNYGGVVENSYDAGWNDPFQYYASTNNAHHLPPTSTALIGHTDQANHQYGIDDFWAAADTGNLPAVSFLKAPVAQQGHPSSSSPLDEQRYLVETINHLQQLPSWKDTAVVITWDESDGWYDHAMPPIINGSTTVADSLTAPGACGNGPSLGTYQGRCGYGTRIPELVISPYARKNFVDHSLTAQSSISRFIEDNWHLGSIGDNSFDTHSGTIATMVDFSHPAPQPLILDPATGEPLRNPHQEP